MDPVTLEMRILGFFKDTGLSSWGFCAPN